MPAHHRAGGVGLGDHIVAHPASASIRRWPSMRVIGSITIRFAMCSLLHGRYQVALGDHLRYKRRPPSTSRISEVLRRSR